MKFSINTLLLLSYLLFLASNDLAANKTGLPSKDQKILNDIRTIKKFLTQVAIVAVYKAPQLFRSLQPSKKTLDEPKQPLFTFKKAEELVASFIATSIISRLMRPELAPSI